MGLQKYSQNSSSSYHIFFFILLEGIIVIKIIENLIPKTSQVQCVTILKIWTKLFCDTNFFTIPNRYFFIPFFFNSELATIQKVERKNWNRKVTLWSGVVLQCESPNICKCVPPPHHFHQLPFWWGLSERPQPQKVLKYLAQMEFV